MPCGFESEKQRKYMFHAHPQIAQRMAKHWKTVKAKHSEFDKESKEHPELPGAIVQQIVQDHEIKRGQHSKYYLHPGEKPPKGYSVQRGERGGTYYEAGPEDDVMRRPKIIGGVTQQPRLRDERGDLMGNNFLENIFEDLYGRDVQYGKEEILADLKKSRKAFDKVVAEAKKRGIKAEAKHIWHAFLKKVESIGNGKAQHSGLASIPTDYKKDLDQRLHKYRSKIAKHWKASKGKHTQTIQHGEMPSIRTARHQDSGIGMRDYALLDVALIKEGDWRTQGVAYHYPWEIIDKYGDTFKGKEFFLNHNGEGLVGTEMGIIGEVYRTNIEGQEWLCAKVKVPESAFTQPFLERVQNGLIKNVSSTHNFKVDVNDPTKTVIWMNGKAVSAVRDGEVDGAQILGVKRHVKSPEYSKALREKLGKKWKEKGGLNG